MFVTITWIYYLYSITHSLLSYRIFIIKCIWKCVLLILLYPKLKVREYRVVLLIQVPILFVPELYFCLIYKSLLNLFFFFLLNCKLSLKINNQGTTTQIINKKKKKVQLHKLAALSRSKNKISLIVLIYWEWIKIKNVGPI